MPKLVVLLEQLFAPVPGGTGRYSRELTAALATTAPA
ncbi:MAG: glycosyltransferase family 1 protein, partial [Pseudonocardiaceae bacterium]